MRAFDGLETDERRAYVAHYLGLPPAVEHWPMATIDRLVSLAERKGETAFQLEVFQMLQPPPRYRVENELARINEKLDILLSRPVHE